VPAIDTAAEWLEADGLGGYASGTVGTLRTRRYHGVRVTATQPPAGRVVCVAGMDVEVDCGNGAEALASQWYAPGVTHPALAAIESFALDPWPAWTFVLADGTAVRAEIFCTAGRSRTLLRWTRVRGGGRIRLRVRPLLAARDYHSLQRENGAVDTQLTINGGRASWRLYPDALPVTCVTNGEWRIESEWYRQFLYEAERARGLDAIEDLIAIGSAEFDLAPAPAVMAIGDAAALADVDSDDPASSLDACASAERRRRQQLGGSLEQAADQYLVARGAGRTVIAGYPWFTDWGRDTFIAMRGLCFATGRLADARDILLEWSSAVSGGMLPNRFPDAGADPEYNAVDASLWFVIVAGELLAHPDAPTILFENDRTRLDNAIVTILEGYGRGTRYGIRCDHDGLLAAGVDGIQLTWMDARVGDRVITPRIGKPVEVQALWINALDVGSRISRRWQQHRDRALAAFNDRFWDPHRQALYDVVDADHVAGRVDASVRPNQVFAVGGLPLMLLPLDRAALVVDEIERRLLTPIGLRSLDPSHNAYAPRYEGGPGQRDAAYHQGTVWPWLLGPFIEAWLRVRGMSAAAVTEAHRRFMPALDEHRQRFGMGHLSEVADAEAPHPPGGCPFQAWSLGELLRVRRLLDLNHRIHIH
jgi:predicted glycogen debranching enzyme